MIAPHIDIAITSDAWGAKPKWSRLIEQAVAAAIAAARMRVPPDCELSILLTDDEAVRALNARWRGIDKPTNVLSFPASDRSDIGPNSPAHAMLGDIALGRETIEREAAIAAKPFDHHLQHLVIHGFLHLIGYDHQNDSDAERMEELERQALKLLAVPDPYASGR